MTTTKQTMTIADRIAERMHGGWTTPSGTTLQALCERLADWREVQQGRLGTNLKYTFKDGSSIVITGGGWDVGFMDSACFCWASLGYHMPDCEEVPEGMEFAA